MTDMDTKRATTNCIATTLVCQPCWIYWYRSDIVLYFYIILLVKAQRSMVNIKLLQLQIFVVSKQVSK